MAALVACLLTLETWGASQDLAPALPRTRHTCGFVQTRTSTARPHLRRGAGQGCGRGDAAPAGERRRPGLHTNSSPPLSPRCLLTS